MRVLRGFNLFAGDDMNEFQVLLRGEFSISGFQNKDMAQRLQKASRIAERGSCLSVIFWRCFTFNFTDKRLKRRGCDEISDITRSSRSEQSQPS